MNIVLIYIKCITDKLIQTLVMKRKILELQAHKTPWKFFLSNMQYVFKELLILMVKLFFKRLNGIVYLNRNNSVHIRQSSCLLL